MDRPCQHTTLRTHGDTGVKAPGRGSQGGRGGWGSWKALSPVPGEGTVASAASYLVVQQRLQHGARRASGLEGVALVGPHRVEAVHGPFAWEGSRPPVRGGTRCSPARASALPREKHAGRCTRALSPLRGPPPPRCVPPGLTARDAPAHPAERSVLLRVPLQTPDTRPARARLLQAEPVPERDVAVAWSPDSWA